MMFVFASLNYLKDLKYVLLLAPVAMGALIMATATLVASIPFNLDNINSSFFEFQDLGFRDIITVASINGFSFLCHPGVSPMIK
jgi:amino acid permease